MSGTDDKERDREPRPQDREQVVSVSELKSTILKEALEEQRAWPGSSRDEENRKGRATRMSLSRLSR